VEPGRSPWNVFRSARDAASGLLWAVRSARSLQLGFAVVIVLLAIGVALRASPVELAVMVLGGTLLLAVETLNTAIETLCDYLHPNPDPRIGRVKDVAAAASLVCELGGLAVLLLILVPHVLSWAGP
jgi:diacylglycerol kinase